MPTMKDIAKLAGVSHGTVSNVLNGRGNVSLEKIKLVEEAAEKLGYVINNQAKNLRKSVADIIAVIIPELETPQYLAFYNALNNCASESNYTVQIYLTNYIPAKELEFVRRIDTERVSGVAVITCLQGEQLEVYQRLNNRNVNVIFVEHRPDIEGFNYAGFDFKQAGQDIANYIDSKNIQNVGIFSKSFAYSSEKDFVTSLTEKLKNLNINHVKTDKNLAFNHAFHFFESSSVPEIIVTTSLSMANHLLHAHEYSSSDQDLEIISLANVDLTPKEKHITKYYQNYGQLGQEVGKQLISKNIKPLTLINNTGFPEPYIFNFKNKNSTNTINLLMLDSPSTYALMKLAPAFTQKTGIKLNFAVFSHDELYNTICELQNYNLYDIIRLDVAWLPWFAGKALQKLDFGAMGMSDISDRLIPNALKNYSIINGVPYALPFDLSIQLLFYRKDLFEDPKIKRMYYEHSKSELHIPEDFEEYNSVCSFFTKSLNPNSPVKYGTSLSLGNSSMITCEFIPRLFNFKGYVFDQNGLCNLNTPNAHAALRNYKEAFKYSGLLYNNAWWSESVNQFMAGESASIMVFINHASDIVNTRKSKIVGNIGFSPIPGGHPVLGGGVLGISRYTNKFDECTEFMKWVSSEEFMIPFSFLGGIAPYEDVFNNNRLLELYPWLTTAKEGIINGSTKRLLNRDNTKIEERRIEHILGLAIKNYLLGVTDENEALEYATKQINDFIMATREFQR